MPVIDTFVGAVALAGVVIVIAAALSGAVERFRVPRLAIFLLLGLAIGPHGAALTDFTLRSPALGAVATLSLVLVLFTDAVTLNVADLRRHAKLATVILGPATLITTAAIGAAAYWLLGLHPAAAAIVGAALASTDPVMMRSLLRVPTVPQTARYALGVESGLNDVVLLPIIIIAATLLVHGGMGGHEQMSVTTDVLLKGPLAGAIVGFGAVKVLEYVRRRHGMRRDYESIYVLGVALTAYAFAEMIDGSGFMAAFTAGAVVAAVDVELCECFHEYGEATAEMLLLFAFVAFGTSLIWTGLDVLDARTIAFALLALVARSAVLGLALLPIEMDARSRRLIVWYGPRALSSLLLVMVAVFLGAPDSERMFSVTALVVLMSMVAHGGLLAGITPKADTPATDTAPATRAAADHEVRITLGELRVLRSRGEKVTIVDARAPGAWRTADTKAAGAVRVDPTSAAESAAALALPRHDWLVAYCA